MGRFAGNAERVVRGAGAAPNVFAPGGMVLGAGGALDVEQAGGHGVGRGRTIGRRGGSRTVGCEGLRGFSAL